MTKNPNGVNSICVEMGNELPGCSEMHLHNYAVNGESHNSDMFNNLTMSISQLISSLSFLKKYVS